MNTTHTEESQHSQQSQSESEENLLTDFIQAVETEYFKQNSTPTALRLSQIQLLNSKLKVLQNVMIPKSQQMIFIDYLLKYVEMALSFVSNFGDLEYKKQKHYATALLSFIPDFFKESDIKNKFVEDGTIKILDLFMYGDFSTISKQELLRMFNGIAVQSKKQVRISTAECIMIYMYKLIDSLSTYGDYVMQSDIMETLYRIFGNQIRNNLLKYELLPGSKDLNEGLVTDISIHDFDADVRRWLNKFNEDSQLIFSIACKTLMFGDTVCKCPEEVSWVDFNLKDNMIGFYAGDSDSDQWNRIIIIAKDVKKVEVNRKFGANANATTISMRLSKPCISQFAENQEYWNLLEKHFKMIISNVEKEKITKLISHVLPRLFGDTFSHTSARISEKLKRVYKPLGIKISKRKSTNSDLSSGTSKSKSDILPAMGPEQPMAILAPIVGQSVSNGSDSGLQDDIYASCALTTVEPVMQPEPSKRSMITVVSSSVSKVTTDRASPIGMKQSKVKPSPVLRTDISVVATDFTRFSSYTSDRASVITSNNSEIFLSRAASPELIDARSLQKQGREKVQDNIVTSSHGINDDILPSPRIDILSGHLDGSQPVPIHESISFQPSEVFSSSPVKRSWQIIKEPVSNEEFHSAELENVEQKKDNPHDQKEKHSVLKMSEDMFEDDFETAVEVFNDTIYNEDENNTYNKVSRCVMQPDNSDGEEPEENKANNRTPTKLSHTKALKEISCDESDSDDLPLSKLRPTKVVVIDQEPPDDFNEVTNTETLTQDIFEPAMPQSATAILRHTERHSSDSNSEDIFSRTTQEFPTLNQVVESQGENFTELSLAVNVGVSQTQYSEETNQKISHKSTKKVANIVTDKEENVVNIIDLTSEENTVDFIQGTEIRMVESQNVLLKPENNKEVKQKKSLLNTPDLLNILDQDDSQATVWKDNQRSEVVVEVEPTSTNKNEDNIIDLTDEGNPVEILENVHLKPGTNAIVQKKSDFSVNIVLGQDSSHVAALKDVEVVKDTDAEKTQEPRKENKPVKQKEPRQLIKTGKKIFRLEDVGEATPPDLIASDKENDENQLQSVVPEKQGSQKVPNKESFIEDLTLESDALKNVDEKGDTSRDVGKPNTAFEKGSSGTDTPEMSESQIIKKTIRQPIIRVERMKIIEKDDSSQSDIEWAPEINSENVNFIDTFNKLQKAEENRSMRLSKDSDFIQRKTAKRIFSESEIDTETLMGDESKKPEDEQTKTELFAMSDFAPKKTAKRFKSAPQNENIDIALFEDKNKLVQETTEGDIKTVNVESVDAQSSIPPKISTVLKKSRKKSGQTQARVPLREINQDVLGNIANSSEQVDAHKPKCLSEKCMDRPIHEDPALRPDDGEVDAGRNQIPERKLTDSQENSQMGTKTLEIIPAALKDNEAKENVPALPILRTERDSSPEAVSQALIVTAAQVHCPETIGDNTRQAVTQEKGDQPTPESDLTHDPVKKRLTVRKQRKPLNKKQGDAKSAETPQVEKRPRRSVQPAKESIKEGVKKRRSRKKTEFGLNTTYFKSVDELFNMSCRGIRNRTNNCYYGQSNRAFLNQHLDIVVRSEPKYSSSDESPDLAKIIDEKKIPQLPKTPLLSSEYSWPELEQVPMYEHKAEPSRKINILQDILIQPKRPSNEQVSNQVFKKPKIDEEPIIEHVPLPTLHEDDEPPTDGFPSSHLPEQKEKDVSYEAFRLIKFVISLVETKHDPDSVRKLKSIIDCADQFK